MGFFKKLWKVHDQVFHPIETTLKKKGGSNNISGLLKGAGISPKDAPVTVPGSTFQQRPGYNPATGMFDTPSTGATLPGMAPNINTGGRTYAPNPFAQQQNLANAVRNPMPPAQSMPAPQVPAPQQPPQQQGQGIQPGMNPQALNMMLQQGRAGMF